MSEDTTSKDTNPVPNPIERLKETIRPHTVWSTIVALYLGFAFETQHRVALASEAYGWSPFVQTATLTVFFVVLPFVMLSALPGGMRLTIWGFIKRQVRLVVSAALGSCVLVIAILVGPSLKRDAPAIAVLPFANISGDKDQESFSAGISEEITSALFNIRALRVIGRESVFAFNGENIARSLGVKYLVDGSVRKDGEFVRITARLVQADNSSILWNEEYDHREMTDVFRIEEDIATKIAGALRKPLGLKPGEHLVPAHNIDPKSQSYFDYHKAKALFRQRGGPEGPPSPPGPLSRAVILLETVARSNPNNAPTQILLAQDYGLIAAFRSLYFSGSDQDLQDIIKKWLPKAEIAANEALRLAGKEDLAKEDLVAAYEAKGSVYFFRGNLLEAEDWYQKALDIDPDNADVLHLDSLLLANAGHLKKAVEMRRHLQEFEPFVPVFNAFTADFLWLEGQDDAALKMLHELPSYVAGNPFVTRQFGLQYATGRDYPKASEFVLKTSDYDPNVTKLASEFMLATPDGPVSPQNLGIFSLFNAFSSVPDRALDSFEANYKAEFWAAWDAPQFWHPAFSNLRKTERFKALMRETGLVEYWRKRGWPDRGLCHRIGSDDFACD